jgi:hypothetical protein
MDLRTDSILDSFTVFLEQQKDGHVPQGMELWLREPESSKSKQNLFVPVKCWVDHRKRVVQSDLASEADGNAMTEKVETDNCEHCILYKLFVGCSEVGQILMWITGIGRLFSRTRHMPPFLSVRRSKL